MKRLRRADDQFAYEVVQVGTFEDAVIPTICNHNLQTVVIRDGFEYGRVTTCRCCASSCCGIWEPAPRAPSQVCWRRRWRGGPAMPAELDVYLLTDRAVEALAGSDEAAPLRRIFHNVEEPMELHLAILDGIGDRYDTRFFDNLKKYAQRPIGRSTRWIAARSRCSAPNWIRDMGHFYGINLFLAGVIRHRRAGQPARADRQHQEGAGADGARVRRQAGLLRHQRTSTSNKIVVQAICKPGDIVIVDRNCHKSHHYGLVLSAPSPTTSKPSL